MNSFNTSDGVELKYEIKGVGDPIILLHGFGADHNVFRFSQKILSKSNKTIAIDLRGHGKSEKGESKVTIDLLTRDLYEFINHLEINEFHLLGYSMGGGIALNFIEKYGDSRIKTLILVESTTKIINDEFWNGGLFLGEYTIIDHIKTLSVMELNWKEFCHDFIKKLTIGLKENDKKASLDDFMNNNKEVLISLWKSLGEKDFRTGTKKFNKPVLVINSENSNFYTKQSGESNSKLFLKGKTKTIKGTHLLVLENPVEFNRVIGDYINSNF